MSTRKTMLQDVSGVLGSRALVWAGLRADDVESIAKLPQLSGCFSIIGGPARRSSVEQVNFEDLTGSRMDLDSWDIEDHLETPEARQFRESLLRKLASDSALLPYRPSNFLSGIAFARRDRCWNLGLFGSHQAIFEHKPWVETCLANPSLELPRVEWRYFADEEHLEVARLLRDGPVMLRPSRSSGGEGLVRVDDPGDLRHKWPKRPEGLVSVSRYLPDAIATNIGATVWRDEVTFHHPSVQLIGIPECTPRPFGYCGNDFALAKQLDKETLCRMETATKKIGAWLRGYGYLGTFGVDFLIDHGVPLFSEINPRFQGSTHASCQLSSEADESCLLLHHLGAMLDLEPPAQPSLCDIARDMAPLSHVVIHWTGAAAAALDPASLVAAFQAHPAFWRCDVATRPALQTQPGGVVARITLRGQLTNSGFDLTEPWATLIASWREATLDKAKGHC